MYKSIELQFCIPETNVILYDNYNSIKKSLEDLFIYLFIYLLLFRDALKAYGSFQARGQIGAVATIPTPQPQQCQI